MLKKLIFSSVLGAALSLSAFAACGQGMGMGACDTPRGGCKASSKTACGDKTAACKIQKGSSCAPAAKGCGDMGKGGGCCGDASSLATIKLTAEQKAKIEAIDEEFRSEMAKLHIKDGMPKDPFVSASGFNKEEFKKAMKERMEKRLELKSERLSKIWATLTPEQQKSIASLAK